MNEKEERERILVENIRNAANHIAEKVRLGRENFLAPPNWSDRSAVRDQITALREAAKKLGEGFHQRNPAVPWKDIQSLRKRIVHVYDADVVPLTDSELWVFAERDVPGIRRKLERPVYSPASEKAPPRRE